MNQLIEERHHGVVTSKGNMTLEKAAYNSKKNCRRCYGRGTLTFSPQRGVEQVMACSCVAKRLQK